MKAKKLTRTEMKEYIESVMRPIAGQYSAELIDERLFVFCLNCPDPVGALDAVIEAPRGSTVDSVIDSALAMPAKAVSSWGEESLALDHPLRTWTVG